MKAKKGGSSTAPPPPPRELLCPGVDKRREKGITYLACFPPSPPSVGSFPSSLLYHDHSGNRLTKRFFLFFCRFRLRSPFDPPIEKIPRKKHRDTASPSRGSGGTHMVVYVDTYRVCIEINHCVRHGSKAVQTAGRLNSDGLSIGPVGGYEEGEQA